MISTTENAMNIEEKNEQTNAESVEQQTESLNELQRKIWAVVSFEKCEKTDLTYEEAVAEMERLKAEKISGLCIITAESAANI